MTKHPYSRWCGCQDCLFASEETKEEPEPDMDPQEDSDPGPQTLSDLRKRQGLTDLDYLADAEHDRKKDDRLTGDAL